MIGARNARAVRIRRNLRGHAPVTAKIRKRRAKSKGSNDRPCCCFPFHKASWAGIVRPSSFVTGSFVKTVKQTPSHLPKYPDGIHPSMTGCECAYCGFMNDDLNPFSRCMQCGQPLEMRFERPSF